MKGGKFGKKLTPNMSLNNTFSKSPTSGIKRGDDKKDYARFINQ